MEIISCHSVYNYKLDIKTDLKSVMTGKILKNRDIYNNYGITFFIFFRNFYHMCSVYKTLIAEKKVII